MIKFNNPNQTLLKITNKDNVIVFFKKGDVESFISSLLIANFLTDISNAPNIRTPVESAEEIEYALGGSKSFESIRGNVLIFINCDINYRLIKSISRYTKAIIIIDPKKSVNKTMGDFINYSSILNKRNISIHFGKDISTLMITWRMLSHDHPPDFINDFNKLYNIPDMGLCGLEPNTFKFINFDSIKNNLLDIITDDTKLTNNSEDFILSVFEDICKHLKNNSLITTIRGYSVLICDFPHNQLIKPGLQIALKSDADIVILYTAGDIVNRLYHNIATNKNIDLLNLFKRYDPQGDEKSIGFSSKPLNFDRNRSLRNLFGLLK